MHLWTAQSAYMKEIAFAIWAFCGVPLKNQFTIYYTLRLANNERIVSCECFKYLNGQ